MFSLLLDLVGFFLALRKMLHILFLEKVDVTHLTYSMCVYHRRMLGNFAILDPTTKLRTATRG